MEFITIISFSRNPNDFSSEELPKQFEKNTKNFTKNMQFASRKFADNLRRYPMNISPVSQFQRT